MNRVAQTLTQSDIQLKRWLPQNFDPSKILSLYARLAAYVNVYSQPKNRYTIKLGVRRIFRTVMREDKLLRALGDFSKLLPELLNPGLKGYFETLTERDRFTTQIDTALEPWDVWLTPVAATAAFTHRPSWSAVDVNGTPYPHVVANGAYTMLFNLSGHPAVVIPIGKTVEGLPIGLQVVGKQWHEMELIAIAQQIDKIVGDFQYPVGY